MVIGITLSWSSNFDISVSISLFSSSNCAIDNSFNDENNMEYLGVLSKEQAKEFQLNNNAITKNKYCMGSSR